MKKLLITTLLLFCQVSDACEKTMQFVHGTRMERIVQFLERPMPPLHHALNHPEKDVRSILNETDSCHKKVLHTMLAPNNMTWIDALNAAKKKMAQEREQEEIRIEEYKQLQTQKKSEQFASDVAL